MQLQGGVRARREVVCRISPINASAIWAKFVPCSTFEGSESVYRKCSCLTDASTRTSAGDNWIVTKCAVNEMILLKESYWQHVIHRGG